MNRRLVAAVAALPLVLGLSACDFTARATADGSVITPTASASASPTTSAPVGVPSPSGSASATATATTEPTTTTVAPTSTTVPPTTTTTAPPVVGVPQPGDEDFVELDCADFPLEQADGTLLDAQDVFDTNRLDIHGLDADGDGTACEDTDPAAVANDNVADSPDESNDDAADVAVSPDAAEAGITLEVRSY